MTCGWNEYVKEIYYTGRGSVPEGLQKNLLFLICKINGII